jgi:lipopolysaccharide biosynthesis glycosyltransferase|tara:strand:+ start:1435 stop:2118 length:684 start_codon:yes stop_codon:yes gene_type:complete
MYNVFVGWDSREEDAYKVCEHTLRKHSSVELNIVPLKREELIEKGLYTRDEGGSVSTEFAYTRFLTPHLSEYKGWSLFIDCDFLFTRDVAELFSLSDPNHAAMCVQHDYTPSEATKMDGQKQVAYPRKNWSSCVLWNCGHPANAMITPDIVNTETGAFLHRFQWLPDNLIGELPLEWNWLEGEYEKPDEIPAVIHYTNGGAWFKECQDVDYAQEWLDALQEASECEL